MKSLLAIFFRISSFLISSLPLSIQTLIGKGIGLLWFDVLRIRRKVAIENVGIAYPEKSEDERTALARESLKHFGRTFVEYTHFPFLDEEEVRKTMLVEGMENIEKALKEGKGMIMLTLHLGNGDLILAGLSRLGLPINLISKEFKSRWLNELWFGMRRKHGTRFISPEKSSFDILKALRRNEIVVFVLDQFMGPPVGVRTNFFGKVTGTALGCAIIAQRTGAPVVPAFTYRLDDGPNGIRHIAHFDEAISYNENDLRDKNIAGMTQTYTDKIESIVRQHPEQWMWIHRRWKAFRD